MRFRFHREKLAAPLMVLTAFLFILVVLVCLNSHRISKLPGASEDNLKPANKDHAFGDLLQRLVTVISIPQQDVCEHTEDVGGNWDFGFLDGVWTICLDNFNTRKDSKGCLVYSFGVGNDWSFDDAVNSAGCEVYSFDPTINRPSQKRSDRHWFYKWGLVTDIPYVRREWTLLTFEEIRRRLGHENRFVDIVKMDVEGAEWKFLESANAFTDIGQLTIEIHPFRHIRENQTLRLAERRISLLENLITEHVMTLFHVRKNPAALDLITYLNVTPVVGIAPGSLPGEILYELSFKSKRMRN